MCLKTRCSRKLATATLLTPIINDAFYCVKAFKFLNSNFNLDINQTNSHALLLHWLMQIYKKSVMLFQENCFSILVLYVF